MNRLAPSSRTLWQLVTTLACAVALCACGGGGGGDTVSTTSVDGSGGSSGPPPVVGTGAWTVRLAWNAASDAGVYGYRVYHSVDAADPGLKSDLVGGSSVDFNVDSTGRHYFAVVAVDAFNQESPRSETVAVDIQ